jgi:ribonuclease J
MDLATGDLAFLPLGGTGEIGMNLNLYRCRDRWLAVDCGIGFGGSEMPEVEIMLADPAFIAERRDRLVGLVITHAHEDHIGGVAWLWRQLRCPVYASPFAATVLRRKLAEAGMLNEVPVHVVPLGGAFDLPPFQLQFLPVSHSIPEAQALGITTPHGTILHTGDWKLDDEPLIGPATNPETFTRFGDRGVLALVCDSTNAMVEGTGGSEGTVRSSLSDLIAGIRGRIAVTCFASNVARVESIALAAREAGRSVALVGRSLRNLDAAARTCGYLRGIPEFLNEDQLEDVPDDNLLILITGSQGEPRSALARVAADQHRNLALGEGDTVIFSSRVIPGNERAIGAVQDNLVRGGVRLITADDHLTHVSGHPAREDLKLLYSWVRPRYSVPVHGEWRHLSAHAALAQELGVKPFLLENGDILALAPGRPDVVDSAKVGRLAVDGGRLVPLTGGVLAARRRMLFNGVVLASVAVDGSGHVLGAPKLSAPGLFDDDDPEAARVGAEFAALLGDLPPGLMRDDAEFAEAARSALRRALGRRLQKRPLVDVHVLRV